MSYFYNQRRREIKASGTSMASAGNTVYITLPRWYSFAVLKNLYITSSNAVLNPTVTVVNHSGEDANSTVNTRVWGSFAASNFNSPISCNDTYVEDLYRTDCLYLKISASSITAGTIFKVLAVGETRYPNDLDAIDNTPWEQDISMKTFVAKSDGTVRDFTTELKAGDNIYGFPVLSASSDWLYIGSFRAFDALYFDKGDDNDAVGLSDIEYWNGSAFTNLLDANMIDGTSNNDSGSLKHLVYSGVLRIVAPNDWVPADIDADPMKAIYAEAEANYNQYPDKLIHNQVVVHDKRYWIRIQANSGLPLKLSRILRVKPV